MKRRLSRLSRVLALVPLYIGCSSGEGAGGSGQADTSVPDTAVPDTSAPVETVPPEQWYLQGGPAPEVPTGQIWDALGTQMALNNETESLVRENLLDADLLTVMICGSGSPLPGTPGAQACTAVFANGQFLLFDAGDGAQHSMEELRLPIADLSAVFITHFHNDHYADLGEVIQRSWVQERRHKLPIYAGVGLEQVIDGISRTYDKDYGHREDHHGAAFLPKTGAQVEPHVFDLQEGESAVVYEKDGVVVTAFGVHHPPVEPALGYAVTYAGKKIVISGDTAYTDALKENSKDADVLVSEVMSHQAVTAMEAISASRGWYYNATVFRDIRDYHIDVPELGALAQASGVRTLILTHMIPNFDNATIQNLWYILPIQGLFSGNLRIARDGTTHRIRLSGSDERELVTERYPSGALRSEISYINGVKDGLALYWHENGDRKSEVNWTMGSGRAVNYAPGGKLIVPRVHPEYSGKLFALHGARALIVTTSVSKLGEGGAATGVFASEMTAPYYEFQGAGMDVDVASIAGGKIPIDPLSFLPAIISKYDQRYLKDPVFLEKTNNSLKIDDIDFTQYDVIFLAGGWGAAYDLGFSEVLGDKMTEAYRAGIPLGAVCHGALGFLKARDEDGDPLVRGRRMTGVTDKQVSELGLDVTPQHPERELRAAGALFESITAANDFMANHIVADGLIVTGQNQNAGPEAAHWLMELIEARR